MRPRYLPSTISLTRTGAESSSVRLPLRRSSLKRRIESSGTTSSMRKLATPNRLPATRSVTPVTPLGGAARTPSTYTANSQPWMSCTANRSTQASGERNRLRSSRQAMVKAIMRRSPRPTGHRRRW